jgi:stress response protein SCP2
MERGFRGKLTDYIDPSKEISVDITVSGPAVYDYCCFGVDGNNKLSDERYMIFFNQTKSPANEIVLALNDGGGGASYHVNLSHLPNSINKLVFTASIDGDGTMGAISRCSVNIGGSSQLQLNLSGSDFKNEKAIIVIEIYKKDVWRISAVASGFNGGLSDLLKAYGGEEVAPQAATPLAPSAPAVPAKVSLEKKLEKAPALVSLAKPLKVSLEKHNLTDTIARVALTLDISGSMTNSYGNGTVQKIVNKMLPIAVQFDDDGELDFWYYGSSPKRMPSVNIGNYQGAVPRNWQKVMASLGYGNNECKVMQQIIDEYKKSELPAYVIFITDGGVGNANGIKRLLTEASHYPIFWQFVGISGSNYGVLKDLDSMSGRYVDNANFFALDDFNKVSNSDLYDRLLTEFPQWLREVKGKGMI